MKHIMIVLSVSFFVYSIQSAHSVTLNFGNSSTTYSWTIKNENGAGPGPNDWSNSTTKIWVDDSGALHLTISTTAGSPSTWYCTEVDGPSLGFGTYLFHTKGNPGNFDKYMVAATFLYASDSQELDIERSYWAGSTTGSATDLDYAVQTGNGDYVNFYQVHQGSNPSGDTANMTQVITWIQDSAFFQMYYGYQTWGILTVGNPDILTTYLNISKFVPQLGSNMTTDINFWLDSGHAPATGQGAEWVVSDFTFYPNDTTAGGYWASVESGTPVELSIFEVTSTNSDPQDIDKQKYQSP